MEGSLVLLHIYGQMIKSASWKKACCEFEATSQGKIKEKIINDKQKIKDR